LLDFLPPFNAPCSKLGVLAGPVDVIKLEHVARRTQQSSEPFNSETSMRHRLSTLCLLLGLMSNAAFAADDIKLYRSGETVNPQDVADVLGGATIKYRSIRLLDESPAAAPAGGASGAATAAKALALPVQFSFDSADITPTARPQLDALAEGIRLLPKDKLVAIEGHTDALGSEDYNARLSMRRAQSVKHYLVAQHGIDPARLRAIGMGEYEPLPGRDPLAPENRRVQFRGEASAL
jgi:outer membrane protein OmpA-like peptidoglycan-associated protein